MIMFYGVKQSTDMRNKQTEVKKFKTETALKKWLSYGGGNFTYDDPEEARNYHHSFKSGYELNGRINKKDRIFQQKGSRDYPKSNNDKIASYLYVYGRSVE